MTGLVEVTGPEGRVAEVRLNRPQVRNALGMELRRELARAFETLSALPDDALSCVILTGGDSVFAAGADIDDMVSTSTAEMYLRHNERLWAAVGDCPVPVIAAVEGYALGGGLELAMHADIIIAGEGARLGQPEVRVGIMPGAGGTQRLTRAVGKFVAMRMLCTGTPVTGAEAAALGLASMAVPDGTTLGAAREMAAGIARMPPLALRQIKEVVALGADAPLSTALALERKALQILFDTRDKREGMTAFREKRTPVYTGR